MPVNQSFTREAGALIWGFPKTIERIGDHAENLGERIAYIIEGTHPEAQAAERAKARQQSEAGPDQPVHSRGLAVIDSVADLPEQGDSGRPRIKIAVRRCSYIDSFSGEEFKGVASNYLCDLHPGDELTITGPVGMPFEVPDEHDANLILIATSTGIATSIDFIRGSAGYGSAFGNEINNAYPDKDFDDLMNGVDEVISRGYVDESNMFVYGCSGGGVLTSWIVGHTDRFAAACSERAPADAQHNDAIQDRFARKPGGVRLVIQRGREAGAAQST